MARLSEARYLHLSAPDRLTPFMVGQSAFEAGKAVASALEKAPARHDSQARTDSLLRQAPRFRARLRSLASATRKNKQSKDW
ncbi:MAG: hypothetical protein ACM3X4_09915 [Ignavibacteriales bacterium]